MLYLQIVPGGDLVWMMFSHTLAPVVDETGMSLFDWKPDYSVGNTEIDQQHKQLFRMAGELHDAMMSGHGADAVEQLLDKLLSYTCYHFASEERLMKESGYPGLPQHHNDHAKLTSQVVEFQAKVKARKAMVTIDMMQFLREWLVHHIGSADAKVGAHLKSRLASSIR
jgi:hemerythrin